MFTTINVIFYPKSRPSDPSDEATIYARITLDGRRAELSTGKRIDPKKWDSNAGRMRGKTPDIISLNHFLDTLKNKCISIYDSLVREGESADPDTIKNIFLGKTKRVFGILEIFQNHNEEMESLLGKDYNPGTLQRYKAAYNHVADFIHFRYQRRELPLTKLDHAFITGFEYFLKSRKRLSHNSAVKYIVNLKKIVRIAYANEWIERDPFFHWKATWKNKERQYLTEDELARLRDKQFSLDRLQTVKEIFLFCCYTGLAFADVEKMTPDDLVWNVNGQVLIKTRRKKTKVLSSIPLLPIPEAIIRKYESHPKVEIKGTLLPVCTNQRMNSYLK